MSLLQHITRATGERQDLPSIFQVVLGSLEENLPIDFGCFLLHDPAAQVADGRRARQKAAAALPNSSDLLPNRCIVPIDPNGLSRCVAGELVYEPDVAQVPFPFPQRLARAALRSVVIAPLIVENQVFGVLVCARAAARPSAAANASFSSS